MEAIILFAIGLILVAVELFMPGFGLFGLLGVAAVIGSMFLASFSTAQMLISLIIAVAVAAIVAFVIFRYFGARLPMSKLVLTEATTSEKGYVSNVTRKELIGMKGKTLTPLRPSGSALFGSERLDVVSEGSYIDRDRNVVIVETSGSRIVVREVTE